MHRLSAVIFVPVLVILFIPSGAKKGKSLISEIDDLKEFKKTLRTKTNLLVVFAKSGMMCTLCIRHQRRPVRCAVGAAPWVDVPCTWITRDSLNRHQKAGTHMEAKQLEANRLAPRNIAGQLEAMSSLQKMARISAFKNLYWLMKQEIPHTTNYLPLNDLVKLQGCSILSNMNRGENDKGESQRFVQEAVLAMGTQIRQQILDQAIKSPWYTIMVDETTDVAVLNEMTVYIRFLKDGLSQTRFLSILPLPNGKADTITKSLTSHLGELQLPLAKMCAFGSDGASVMVGAKNGVAAQLRQLIPHLINNHCVAHRLALAAGQASKGLPYLQKFKDILGDLYRFYAKSAVRTQGLRDIQELLQEPGIKLVEAKDVRWLSHDKATTTLRRCLPSVYTSLEGEAEERNDSRAAGLSKFTQNYQFVLTLHMMCDVLPHLSDLSKAMQKRDAIYTCIKPLVRGTLAVLQSLLTTPGSHFQAAPERVASLQADGFSFNVPTPEQVDKFTQQVYKPFLQQLITNIKERFPDLPVLELFEVFDTTKFPDGDLGNHGESEIKELAKHFNLPVEKTLYNWQQVRGSLHGTSKNADEAMEWVTTNLQESHDHLYKLAAVGLLLPSSTADNAASKQMSLLEEVAEEIRGKGTIAYVDCSDAKKLCKNLKASPSQLELRHYKDGDFNKNYDRKMVKKSLVNFMLDPTGDIPWDEEVGSEDVVHIDSEQNFHKLLKKDKHPVLVMFYAPWCGFCKRLKPEFAAAATELKGQVTMVGVDVDKPQQMNLRAQFNITGFPTLYYFENGKIKFKYGGENNKEGLINWLKDPKEPEEPKPETQWEDEAPEIFHLHENTWEDFMSSHGSVLVMFYAPWCGHCKKMKPEYQEAAQSLKDENIDGYLAAVDATVDKKLGDQFKIQGFPTVKYFKNGEFQFDFNERTADKIVEFMKDPKEPPPPPEPEKSWEETESEVEHLSDENFKAVLKKKKHALVMFYAPWCGHCKKAKPEFMTAAEQFKDDPKVVFAAMDCTVHRSTCTAHDVSGYPTFKYFNYGKNAQKYMGGREEPDFVKFMKDPLNTEPEPSKPPSPSPEEHWSDVTGNQNIVFPSADNFDSFLKEHNSVLVMFYAPWCGHCKAMKPAYGEAATRLKDEKIPGVLAAVDATRDAALANTYDVRGYPTLKYFKDGKFAFDYNSGRSTADLVAFMKNPKEPGPPPAAEPAWDTVKSAVNHLTGDNFDTFTKSKDAVLVMFYAPWCGHCKKAKPAYQGAADKLSDTKRALAAVDCTSPKNKDLCSRESVKGFPTIKLYTRGSFLVEYSGEKTEEEFFKFVTNAPTMKEEL